MSDQQLTSSGRDRTENRHQSSQQTKQRQSETAAESLTGTDYLIPVLEEPSVHQLEMTQSVGPKTVILVSGTTIGQGDQQLGDRLMNQFFSSLTRLEEVVQTVLFVNSGVFLTTQGSHILNSLHSLQERGVEIVSCSTCLEHYQIKDKLCIGTVANMFTITEKLLDSLQVITL